MDTVQSHIKKIVIVGGGSAGWLAAAALSKTLDSTFTRIQLIESSTIGTVGVGEATIPPILNFLNYLGIDEADFMRKTQASFKLGIKFSDWHSLGKSYYHPFGSVGVKIDSKEFYPCWLKSKLNGDTTEFTDFSPAAVMCEQNKFYPPSRADKDSFIAGASYALHFDAGLVAKYLADYAKNRGVERIEADIVDVSTTLEQGITGLVLADGKQIDGDFYIDCSGFQGLLIEKALHSGYEDWREFLPCDRAVAVQTQNVAATANYTLATARNSGWTWKIPLQHRTGNGYVYSSKYCSDDEAAKVLLTAAEGELLTEPRVIPFVTGMRKKMWNKNCVALGLSSGFLEPLESTAIHLVTRGLRLFLDLLPNSSSEPTLEAEYNRLMSMEYVSIRDFIILHYCTSQRTDSDFWRTCNTMEIPESLRYKIDLFKSRGVLYYNPQDLFKPPSWHCVFEGMGVRPARYDPTIDYLADNEVQGILGQVKSLMGTMASGLPTHDQFLKKYCPASK